MSKLLFSTLALSASVLFSGAQPIQAQVKPEDFFTAENFYQAFQKDATTSHMTADTHDFSFIAKIANIISPASTTDEIIQQLKSITEDHRIFDLCGARNILKREEIAKNLLTDEYPSQDALLSVTICGATIETQFTALSALIQTRDIRSLALVCAMSQTPSVREEAFRAVKSAVMTLAEAPSTLCAEVRPPKLSMYLEDISIIAALDEDPQESAWAMDMILRHNAGDALRHYLMYAQNLEESMRVFPYFVESPETSLTEIVLLLQFHKGPELLYDSMLKALISDTHRNTLERLMAESPYKHIKIPQTLEEAKYLFGLVKTTFLPQ